MRAAALGLLMIVAMLPAASPAAASEPSPQAVELVAGEGTVFTMNGRAYRGTMAIRAASDGLVVVELVPLDGYLAGIREVPFSWPDATLQAQAVAARTYLAWTLARGRAGAGRTYGFDICATTSCQVYRGSAAPLGEEGARWLAAIQATAAEILVFDDRPAQTLYSSSSGDRTRANQDVFGGAAKPYLQPVASPEAAVTPYERWSVEIPAAYVVQILRRAGYAVGDDLRGIEVVRPAEGEGGTRLRVLTEQGTTTLSAVDVRWLFNEHGPALYPGLLPGTRPDGRRWPQTVLSYTFDVAFDPAEVVVRLPALLPLDDKASRAGVVFTGTGWGHGVGMSQWGAKAMGDDGATYDEILAHYYGGLQPQDAGSFLPERVAVGLAWGEDRVTIGVRGSFRLVLPSGKVRSYRDGTWNFASEPGGILIVPPDATQLPAVPAGVALR